MNYLCFGIFFSLLGSIPNASAACFSVIYVSNPDTTGNGDEYVAKEAEEMLAQARGKNCFTYFLDYGGTNRVTIPPGVKTYTPLEDENGNPGRRLAFIQKINTDLQSVSPTDRLVSFHIIAHGDNGSEFSEIEANHQQKFGPVLHQRTYTDQVTGKAYHYQQYSLYRMDPSLLGKTKSEIENSSKASVRFNFPTILARYEHYGTLYAKVIKPIQADIQIYGSHCHSYLEHLAASIGRRPKEQRPYNLCSLSASHPSMPGLVNDRGTWAQTHGSPIVLYAGKNSTGLSDERKGITVFDAFYDGITRDLVNHEGDFSSYRYLQCESGMDHCGSPDFMNLILSESFGDSITLIGENWDFLFRESRDGSKSRYGKRVRQLLKQLTRTPAEDTELTQKWDFLQEKMQEQKAPIEMIANLLNQVPQKKKTVFRSRVSRLDEISSIWGNSSPRSNSEEELWKLVRFTTGAYDPNISEHMDTNPIELLFPYLGEMPSASASMICKAPTTSDKIYQHGLDEATHQFLGSSLNQILLALLKEKNKGDFHVVIRKSGGFDIQIEGDLNENLFDRIQSKDARESVIGLVKASIRRFAGGKTLSKLLLDAVQAHRSLGSPYAGIEAELFKSSRKVVYGSYNRNFGKNLIATSSSAINPNIYGPNVDQGDAFQHALGEFRSAYRFLRYAYLLAKFLSSASPDKLEQINSILTCEGKSLWGS